MNNYFTGNWKLVSFESMTEDGDINYPYGKDALGYLTYTKENFMSVSIMRSNRAMFDAGDLRLGTLEEKAAAVDDYLTYCGKYTTDDEKVIHHIEMSLFPNWIGVKQERFYEFEDDRLKLSTAPFLLKGKMRTAHLIWQKVLAE